MWNRSHIRMVFMTPQTFKNDVFVGAWAVSKARLCFLPMLFDVIAVRGKSLHSRPGGHAMCLEDALPTRAAVCMESTCSTINDIESNALCV